MRGILHLKCFHAVLYLLCERNKLYATLLLFKSRTLTNLSIPPLKTQAKVQCQYERYIKSIVSPSPTKVEHQCNGNKM